MSGYLQRLVDTAAGRRRRGASAHRLDLLAASGRAARSAAGLGRNGARDAGAAAATIRTRRHLPSNRWNRHEASHRDPNTLHCCRSPSHPSVARPRKCRPSCLRCPIRPAIRKVRLTTERRSRWRRRRDIRPPPTPTFTSRCRSPDPVQAGDAFRPVMKPARVFEAVTHAPESGDMPRQRHAARAAQQPDDIQIHIGRIEVTAVPPPAPRAPKAPDRSLSLDAYLSRRDGRTR